MFNVGLAEIAVIAIIGLLVFGPDRLPKAVRTLMSGVRSLRESATDASRSLQQAAGLDSGETRQALSELAELHPRRIVSSIVEDASPRPRTSKAPGRLGDFDPDAP